MRAAIHGVDIVGERKHLFVISIVVLNRNFNAQIVAGSAIASLLEVHWLRMKRVLVLVQVLDEFGNAAFVIKFVLLLFIGAFISDRDPDALVQKGFFAQALRQFV